MKLSTTWRLILVAYLFAIAPMAIGPLEAEGCTTGGCEAFCDDIDALYIGCQGGCYSCHCEGIIIPGGGGVCTE